MVSGDEKAVFSLSAGGWTAEHQVALLLSPAAAGCVGLRCFRLVWVKLSSVETKAIASYQTVVPQLTLTTSVVTNTPYLLQPGCHLGQLAHLCPSPACGQLTVELTTCV